MYLRSNKEGIFTESILMNNEQCVFFKENQFFLKEWEFSSSWLVFCTSLGLYQEFSHALIFHLNYLSNQQWRPRDATQDFLDYENNATKSGTSSTNIP